MASPSSDSGALDLLGLFAAPPGENRAASNSGGGDKTDAEARNQGSDDPIENPGTDENDSTHRTTNADDNDEVTPLLFGKAETNHEPPNSYLSNLFADPSSQQQDRRPTLVRSNAPSIREMSMREIPTFGTARATTQRRNTVPTPRWNLEHWMKSSWVAIQAECSSSSTYIGSFMNLLFQVVFALTIGATITRPHGAISMLGLFTKMAAIGIVFGAPAFWIGLPDIPALYPTVDLFTAPFFATIATIVDQELFQDPAISDEENDEYFLATFTFLCSLSMFLSGALLILASVFKLANLGSFLPFPVLCGFFAAVAVLTWTLAFKIDSNGATIGIVLFSGNFQLMMTSMIHHIPSILVAIAMKLLGPKNPFFVLSLVLATIGLFHAYMLVCGISLEEMTENKWFFGSSDLVYDSMHQSFGFKVWETPAPFGWINTMLRGKIHWASVAKGFETTLALSFLYLIRCSLHGAALKKNVPMLSRTEDALIVTSPTRTRLSGLGDSIASLSPRRSSLFPPKPTPMGLHKRGFSEMVDIEITAEDFTGNEDDTIRVVSPNATQSSLKDILYSYGLSQIACALVGSFPVTPNVGAAQTMYSLKAEKLGPQIGSVMFLLVFYLTDFRLVGYIPKPAFSSLLVLAFINMISTWVIDSYFKTKEKMEWLVVPTIVVLAFVVGLLQAVFLGLAMSTFLFVAAFFRSGVVKYVANGMTIRSTIERPPHVTKWLDCQADHIQILILQNYLFFGNASSILSYITSMFEETGEDVDPESVPPVPKILIIDLTLVTGMDTSAVDAFADIVSVCTSKNDCRIFLSGVATTLRETMRLNGLKPEITKNRSERKLRFFQDLESAMGKAEDSLIEILNFNQNQVPRCTSRNGFVNTLCLIDAQHGTEYAGILKELYECVNEVTLEPGQSLYDHAELERGLFFIEEGILKIERSSAATLSRSGTIQGAKGIFQLNGTMKVDAGVGSIGRNTAIMKAIGIGKQHDHHFRIARVGPGWITGLNEALGGTKSQKQVYAMTKCKLHHLSYKKVIELEAEKPFVTLTLYKLLACLLAKRQESTITQLGTLHSIMTSPAQKRPIGRSNSRTQLR